MKTQMSVFIMDQVSDRKNSDENWLSDLTIHDAIEKLNDRERLILTKRFFDGKTQIEVANEIGISQAQVSRLEKSALFHMRRYV